MFRIDRQNVKITGAPPNNVIEKIDGKNAAASPSGEQPYSTAALTAAQEALIAQQLEDIDAARWDVEKRVREQEEEALKLRVQAENRVDGAREQAKRITDEARAAAKAETEMRLSAAQQEAQAIIKAAREQADAEALEIRGQAWKSGFAEGREEGEKQAAAEAESLANDVRTLVEGLERGHKETMARLEKDIIKLSLSIAKKIVNVAIKKDDNMFEALIKNALNQMKREGKLSIRLSEEDCSRLFPDGSASFVLGGQTVTATAVSDPTLQEGDCILESESEIVDAGVNSQIRAVAVAFESLGDTP